MSHDLLKNPLPEPWTFGVTKDGRIFFVNDEKKVTTWLHPETRLPMMTGYYSMSSLPKGWQQGFLNDGDAFYINHNKQITTMYHPKFSSSREKEKNVSAIPKKRSSSFRETITKPLYRLSSFQEKTFFSTRKNHSNERKNTVQRDAKVAPAKSGWLFKRDHTGGVKVWRKRWFVLTNLCLLYYKDEKECEPLGSIVLPSYKISTINSDNTFKRKYAFKIEHSGMRSYYLSAESYNDMAKWVAEISKACSFALEQSAPKKPSSSQDKKNKIVSENNQVSEQNDIKSASSISYNSICFEKLSQNLPKQKDLESHLSTNSYDLDTSTSSSSYTLPKYSNFSDFQPAFNPEEPIQNHKSMHYNTLPSRKTQSNDFSFSTGINSEEVQKVDNEIAFHTPVIKRDPSNPALGANYEVKQVNIYGKKGQYRAFAISRSCSTMASATPNQPGVNKNVKKHQIKTVSMNKSNESHQIEANEIFRERRQIQSDPVIERSHMQGNFNESGEAESILVSPRSSVDTLTAAMLSGVSRPTSTQEMNLSRTKSASERLLNKPYMDMRSAQDPVEIKKMQQQINKFRIRSLKGDYYRNGASPNGGTRSHIATDMRSAMRYQRMPKVLRRARNGLQHPDVNAKSSFSDYHSDFESDRSEYETAHQKPECSSVSDQTVSPSVVEVDIEPDDAQIDLNLANQLFIPNKVDIPDRLMEYEDVELSPEQEKMKQKKIRAIESLLAKSGQSTYKPSVHLAAALAAEAGTVARAVAHQAHQNKEFEPSFV